MGMVMFMTCLDKVMLLKCATRQEDVINYQSRSWNNLTEHVSRDVINPFDVLNEEIKMLNRKFPVQHFS